MADEQTPEIEAPETPESLDGPENPLADIDPEKMKLLEEKFAAFRQGGDGGTTVTGSEAPSMDLSRFEIPENMMHMYRRAKEIKGPNGEPVWAIIQHEYLTITGSVATNANGVDSAGLPKRLDQRINVVINGPEGQMSVPSGWRLSALIPNGIGSAVAVFERDTKVILPTPELVKTDVEVAPVDDEELKRMQEKAQNWTKGEETKEGDPDKTSG